MNTDQIFPYSGDLNNDPDIYHILSSSTAGSNAHGYKQVWLTTGGNNPSYPYAGGDNPVPAEQWESFNPDIGYEKIDLKKGQSFHVTPGTIHRFCAPYGDVELAEVSTPELYDVVRLEDNYGRVD